MNYEEIEPYLIDYLQGKADEGMEYRIKAYLQKNPDFQKELDELGEMLGLVKQSSLVEPAPQLKMNFYAMLNTYKVEEAKDKPSFFQTIQDFFAQKIVWQRFALATVVLFVFLTGYWTATWIKQDMQLENQLVQQQESKKESPTATFSKKKADKIEDKEAKADDGKENLALWERKKEANQTQWAKSLQSENELLAITPEPLMEISDLDDKRAISKPKIIEMPLDTPAFPTVIESDERIETIYASLNTVSNEDKIINALIQALMTDPNPNVRIAAIDALEKFAGKESVKYQIVQTLEHQQSPSVQLATIDLIAKYNIKAGAEPLKKLLKKNNLNTKVRQQAEIALVIIS